MAKILIVDDYEMIRTLFKEFLEMAGHEVLTACDGADGLEKFNEQPVNLIISDVSMPGMGGIEMLEALPEQAKEIPIILTSGSADAPVQPPPGYSCQMLLKPIKNKDLIAAIDRALGTAGG